MNAFLKIIRRASAMAFIASLLNSLQASDLFAPQPGNADLQTIAEATPPSTLGTAQLEAASQTSGAVASSTPAPAVSSAQPSAAASPASLPSPQPSPSQSQTPSPGVNPTPKAAATPAQAVPSGGASKAKVPAPLPVDEPPNLQQPPDKMAASAPPPVAPSENVTLNLITRLVQRGILTKEDASDLIRQAKEDAQLAAQQAAATQQALQQSATAQQAALEAAAPPQSDDQVSVSYVPEIVKSEMRDEIKQDVLAAAQAEGWASPSYPSWLNNFRPFMDFRFRYQDMGYPSGNTTNIYDTINFNGINTGSPYNVSQIQSAQSPYTAPPTYNTTETRNSMEIRFRFGAEMNLGDNFTSAFRIATGQNGSPVSENQYLGSTAGTTGQGGNFSDYAIWLDRAFLKYELGENPNKMAAITFGRFDNPFFTPATIMWANDIAFDGITAQARYEIFKGFTPFLTGGIFPVYNTDLNFSSTQQPKQASYDKYLYAAQGGIDWKISKDFAFKGSVGYYDFQNVQGQVSAPLQNINAASDQGPTDNSRPSFAQHGNTYIELRNIQAMPANGYGTQNQYQYFGLATPFQILSANARLEYRHWEPFVVALSGEWDQNAAWNASSIQNAGPSSSDNPYNITGPVNNVGASGNYLGGNNAWTVQLKVGSGSLQKLWDWDFGVGYRYVESDAVIDGFTDSDFGANLAGTNLQGWLVGGNLALSKNVFLALRWFNATQIAGPQIKSDMVQLDLNARF